MAVQRNGLQIDENNLDKEWLAQPSMFFKCAEDAAMAKRLLDQARNKLEVTKAKVSKDVRENPGNYDLQKVTEAAVEVAVSGDDEYQEAQEAVVDARYAVGICDAMVSAMDHRRRALENLVHLFLSSYYSEPRAPRGKEEEVGDMEKGLIRRKGRRGK